LIYAGKIIFMEIIQENYQFVDTKRLF